MFQQRLKSLVCREVLVDSFGEKNCESLAAKAFVVFFKQPIFVEISSLHEMKLLRYCCFVMKPEKVKVVPPNFSNARGL